MLEYPNIDPVIFRVGPLAVHWYGLMYVIGFVSAWHLVRRQARKFQWFDLEEHLDNLNTFLILGVIVGGRLGYVLIYNFDYYQQHLFEILDPRNGGMSFHGGCIGALLCGLLYCRKNRLDFWKGADIYVATAPIGLGFGRIGNFINGELYGRVTDVPWAMVFPHPAAGPLPRHPSQLYEAFLEGIVLFCILWFVKQKPWNPAAKKWPHGSILALFLICYGIFRSLVELVREPDPQIGFLALQLTMGQLLSLTMIVGGIVIWTWRIQRAGISKG